METYARCLLLSTPFLKSILKLRCADRSRLRQCEWLFRPRATRVDFRGTMRGRDLFCARSDIIMEPVAMFKMNARRLVLLAAAGLGLLGAARAFLPRSSAAAAPARADDAKPAGDSLCEESGNGAAAAGAGPAWKTGKQRQLGRKSRAGEFLGDLVPALPRGNPRTAASSKKNTRIGWRSWAFRKMTTRRKMY